MRKMLRLGLCLGVLAAALTCTALAAGTSTPGSTTASDGCTVIENPDGRSYTAAYTGAKEGEQYALLVVRGTVDEKGALPPISDDTIMYIEQTAADDNGTVSFENFIPKSTPDCVVLLGGVFEDGISPKVLGTLEAQGVTVSGSVKYQTPTIGGRSATVELYNEQGGLIGQTQTDANGEYIFDAVPVGEGYKIVVKKLGYLTYTETGINVTETNALEEIDISYIGGDINGDGAVYSEDFQLLLENYNKVSGFTIAAADIDGDGAVYSNDFSILLTGFNKTVK